MTREILIIEDDELWANKIKEIIQGNEYRIRVVETWLTGLEIIRQTSMARVVAVLCANATVEAGLASLEIAARYKPPPMLIITSAYLEPIVAKCLAFDFVRGVVPKTMTTKVKCSR